MIFYILSPLAVVILIIVWLFVISPGKPAPYKDGDGHVAAGSVSEKIAVRINGVRQGMFIRGRGIHNPVLLFLHGGPGMPEYFLSERYETGLEERFTVCYWEQRGAGLSYRRDMNADEITAEQLISDTTAVANYLRARFRQDKIFLLAHSWGTFIGIQAASRTPELYRAYIAVAQISDQRESERLSYAFMLDAYQKRGDARMLRKLEKYPVLENPEALRAFFVSKLRDPAMHRLGVGTMHQMKSVLTGIFIPSMASRSYTLPEKMTLWRAKAFLRNKTGLINQLLSADLSLKIPELELPVYFVSGQYDYTVSTELSKRYFDGLRAPVKGFYTFEDSAHSPFFEEPLKFIKIMLTDVLNETNRAADGQPGT